MSKKTQKEFDLLPVNHFSSQPIQIFRPFFHSREDVFAIRWGNLPARAPGFSNPFLYRETYDL
jgi:hypothetical protein